MEQAAIRQSNFLILRQQYLEGAVGAAEKSVRQRFLQSVGLPFDRADAVFSGSLAIDDGLARQIEQRLSLPDGWMDEAHAAYPGDQDPEHHRQRMHDLLKSAPPDVERTLLETEEQARHDGGAKTSSNVAGSN